MEAKHSDQTHQTEKKQKKAKQVWTQDLDQISSSSSSLSPKLH